MRKLAKLADLCWEGLTLQHVTQKEMVIPYRIFVLLAFLFEVFLVIIFSISSYLFYSFGFHPNLEYYVSAVILIFMLVLTVLMLMAMRK